MGKTGSIEWAKIRGRKGQIRMEEVANLSHKRPGPGQRFNSDGTKRRRIARSEKAIVKS
ncbi:MAG: DUF5350 domain-containing protein [Methanosarcinales archaeon]|nr:DUF5350 domain-containing protein [Methanosarcinales archaeon]